MVIINAECGKTVRIAYQGENKRQQVRFDLADIMAEFPGGTAVLAILRSGDTDPVPAAEVELDTDGKALIWTVTAWECAVEGFVYAQVTYAVDNVVAKTRIWRFDVKNSLVVSAAEPEEWADLVGQLVTAAAGVNTAIAAAQEQLRQYVADAEAAESAAAQSATAAGTAQAAAETAQRAAEEAVGQYDDMTATATGLAAGEEPTAVIDHTGSAPVLRLGIPAGERGADGAQGPQGERGPAGPAGPKGDPGEAADVIDDTAASTSKTYSSSKLETQREELLSAIERKFGVPNVGNGLYVSEETETGRITLNADVTQSDITAIQRNKADIIIANASGSIASISDGADDLPVESMTVQIEPVQDLHGQSSPYPAGGGKNKVTFPYAFPDGVYGGVTFTTTGEKIVASGNTNNSFVLTLAKVTLPAGSYVMSVDGTHTRVQFRARVSGTNLNTLNPDNSYATFTLESESEVTFDLVRTATLIDINTHFQVESGSTPTAWTPFSNICPISGWTGANVYRTGKNLLNIHGTVYDTQKNPADPIALTNYSVIQGWAYTGYVRPNNVTMTIGEDSITMTVPDGTYGVGLIAKVKAGQKYTFSATHNGYVVCGFYTENGTNVSRTTIGTAQSYTVTIPSGAEYAILLVRGIAAGTVTYSNIQFESGEIASTYEPFKASETYPITWEEAGTVYGGTLNPVTGELVVNMAYRRMTYEWINTRDSQSIGFYNNVSSLGGNTVWVRNWLYSEAAPRVSGGIKAVCNAFPISMHNTTIFSAQYRIYFGVGSMTTVEEFKASVQELESSGDGLWIAFELATPITYTLTPTEIRTLLGTNNIWADTGDVSMDYRADTKLYIDNKITAAVAAALNA